jgi:2-methylisocitrate lyase-like PEP mutase family enzyme
MTSSIVQAAHHFRSLHDSRRPLALSNIWDVASALIAQAAGAPALATTSAGVAWAHGLPDGDHLDRARALSAVTAIAAAVKVPVTADIEGGYAEATAGVAETVKGLLGAGVVGINIEDGNRAPMELAARIAVARQAAQDAGVPLFINARTDVFLAGIGASEHRVEEVLARAERYIQAGADGIFVPGVVDPQTIAALCQELPVPLNVMVGVGAPSVAELGRLGVARVSLGAAVALTAYASVRRVTAELLDTGTYQATADALSFGELNDLLIDSTTL